MEMTVAMAVARPLETKLAGFKSVWDLLANIREYVVDALVALAKELGLTDKDAIKQFVLEQWTAIWVSTVKPWADKLNPMPTPSAWENAVDAVVKAFADRLIAAIVDKVLGE